MQLPCSIRQHVGRAIPKLAIKARRYGTPRRGALRSLQTGQEPCREEIESSKHHQWGLAQPTEANIWQACSSYWHSRAIPSLNPRRACRNNVLPLCLATGSAQYGVMLVCTSIIRMKAQTKKQAVQLPVRGCHRGQV